MYQTVEKLLKDLAWKCHQNRLNFEIYPIEPDSVVINVFTFDEFGELLRLSEGHTDGWRLEFESAEMALERIHKEVDAFLKKT